MHSNALSGSTKATNTGLFLWGHFLTVILVAKYTIASSVHLSFTNPKIFFVLGVFHWSFVMIIDNREMEPWPFPPGLAIGMIIAVFHCSVSFPLLQD